MVVYLGNDKIKVYIGSEHINVKIGIDNTSQEITFYVDSVEAGALTALSGMTWQEWCDSSYNADGFSYGSNGVYVPGEAMAIATADGTNLVKPTDVIVANTIYPLYGM